MEYVSKCPHCGRILEKAPELEPVQLEPEAPKNNWNPTVTRRRQGKSGHVF